MRIRGGKLVPPELLYHSANSPGPFGASSTSLGTPTKFAISHSRVRLQTMCSFLNRNIVPLCVVYIWCEKSLVLWVVKTSAGWDVHILLVHDNCIYIGLISLFYAKFEAVSDSLSCPAGILLRLGPTLLKKLIYDLIKQRQVA